MLRSLSTVAATLLLAAACSSPDVQPDVQPDAGSDEVLPPEELAEEVEVEPYGEPPLGPDFNNLQAQPWVEPATAEQANEVQVRDDSLVFPLLGNEAVLAWQPGRVVVSEPASQSGGSNPFGFARRVVAVEQVDNTIVVKTATVELGDVVVGDLQQAFDFATADAVDISNIPPAVLARLYSEPPLVNPFESSDLGNELTGDEPGEDVGIGQIQQPIDWDPLGVGDAVEEGFETIEEGFTSTAGFLTSGVLENDYTVNGSISSPIDLKLFDQDSSKVFNKNGTSTKINSNGVAKITGDVTFKPEVTVTLSIDPIVKTNASVRADFSSELEAQLKLDFDTNHDIQPDGNTPEYLAIAKNRARDAITGSDELAWKGSKRKTLKLSKPKTKTIMVGPVPVVITHTNQLMIECLYEARGTANGQLKQSLKSKVNFWAEVSTDKGLKYSKKPGYSTTRSSSNTYHASKAKAELSCGIVPRVNLLVYDTIGIFAGVRSALVGTTTYKEWCEPDPTKSTPQASMGTDIKLKMSLTVGGRVQPPGSSSSAKKIDKVGEEEGTDITIKSWELYSKTYDKKGFGYCVPLCRNDKFDKATETDVDCGDQCGRCELGKKCAFTKDCQPGNYCSGGKCSLDSCGDKQKNSTETDVDCGGTACPRCAANKKCDDDGDCVSGFCKPNTRIAGAPGTCQADHCTDGKRSGDETGVDCGGERCAKCADGRSSNSAQGCATAYWNGIICTSNPCLDRNVTATVGETDVDCGGQCGPCGATLRCSTNADCRAGLACDPLEMRCVENTCASGVKDGRESDVDCGGRCNPCRAGKLCAGALDCASRLCTDGVCQPTQCAAGLQDRDGDGTCTPDCTTAGLTCGLGSCNDASGTALCVCTTGYTGPTCGTCASGYQDNDLDGICGSDCTTAFLDCGYGACDGASGTALCACITGYGGASCRSCAPGYQDNDVDGTCSPSCTTAGLTCGNGTCDDASGTALCTCTTGYTGPTCSSCASGYQDNNSDGTCAPACATAGLTCGNGACDDASGTAQCACAIGYTGPTCSSCASGYQDNNADGTCSPTCTTAGVTCGNGTCSDASGTAQCACTTGYTGSTCDSCARGYQDLDADGTCSPDCSTAALTCVANSTCDESSGFARCTCNPGYQDNDMNGTCSPTCATAGFTCSGRGTCDDSSGSARCLCNSGYQDNDGNGTCSLACPMASCSTPGAICNDSSGFARCTCDVGYKDDILGLKCSLCATGYQDSNRDGTCLPTCTTAALSCGSGTCSSASGTAMCVCPAGYAGPSCGSCAPGYSGTNCELIDVAGGTATGPDWDYGSHSNGLATSFIVTQFKLDKTEVTVARYQACFTAGQCSVPNTGGACNWQVAGRDNHPINCVDWNQAAAFCAWEGKRLPTEEEWQWAASNGGTTTYPWGNTAPDDVLARWSGYSVKNSTTPVGAYPSGNTSVGLQDMAGNVFEWNASDYSAGFPDKGNRGGAWETQGGYLLRADARNANDPGMRDAQFGFRCAQ